MFVRIVVDMKSVDPREYNWRDKLVEYITRTVARMDDDAESMRIRDDREQEIGKITRTEK